MKIGNPTVCGISSAMWAMRNPFDSWSKSDSGVDENHEYKVGEKDKELSLRLQKAGPEHAKHLRMIQVWVDIEAPRYWLVEMDTYRAGVEKVSCSTMHTITKREFTLDDFEHDDNLLSHQMAESAAYTMNIMRSLYLNDEDEATKKNTWRTLIQNLPQNYIQRRTYMFSYAALRNIVKQRKGHKLKEWAQFIDWCRSLPESWMIFDEEEKEKEK